MTSCEAISCVWLERGYKAYKINQVFPRTWKTFSDHPAWPCCRASDSKAKAASSAPVPLMSHEPQLGWFPCSTTAWFWFTGAPQQSYAKAAGWGKAALQGFSLLRWGSTGHFPLHDHHEWQGHQHGQTWRMCEKRGSRPITCPPWASSEWELTPGRGKSQRKKMRHASGTLMWRLVASLYLQTRRAGYTGGLQLGEGHMQHPKAGKQLQWVTVSPLLLLLLTAKFLLNHRRNIAALEVNSYPKITEHTGNELFLSNTVVLLVTRGPDTCIRGFTSDEVNHNHTDGKELLLFSRGGI